MLKFKDIKPGDLLVLKNSRDVIGTIIGVSDSTEKYVFYYPNSPNSDPEIPLRASYGELSKFYDIIKSGEKKKKSMKSFSTRIYIKKRLRMI